MGGDTTYSTGGSYDWSERAARRGAASYASADRRAYSGYSSKGLKPPKGMEISSESEIPLVLMLDGTGSMSRLPRFILERTPTMFYELNAVIQGYDPKELAKKPVEVPVKLEMSIICIGDAYSDKSPLQVVDFKKHAGLVKGINQIYPEGGGGGTREESYELAAYYLNRHCKTPKSVIKPICIIAGDEAFYDTVDRHQVRELIGDNLKESIDSRDVMKELQKKFDAYILQPEINYSKSEYEKIHEKWREVLPKDRVMVMEDPEAIVNCMIMVSGYASGHFKEAQHALERREEQWEIDQAVRAVHPLQKSKAND